MAWAVGPTLPTANHEVTIEAFSLNTDVLLGSIAIPNVGDMPVKFVRWGSDGLAFLTQGSNGPEPGDGVYIISGSFVTTPSVQ